MVSERFSTKATTVFPGDALTEIVQLVETAVTAQDYPRVLELIEDDPAGVWFGLTPHRTFEILRLLTIHLPSDSLLLQTTKRFFATSSVALFDDPVFLRTIDFNNPREASSVAIIRMVYARQQGKIRDALEHGIELEKLLGKMRMVGAAEGFELQAAVQIGITAMLAGDFTRALANFTRAQLHPLLPKFAFLTRDALTKAALIHVCFGNVTMAQSLVQRADRIARTSSWAEDGIDAERHLIDVLLKNSTHDAGMEHIDAMKLQDIGEMWPFYILILHRVLEAAGHQDELAHRLEMFDAMPFPKFDGDGLTGSVIPLHRAMLAASAGRIAQAQAFMDRADQQLPYTQLYYTVVHLYAGRVRQVIHTTQQLRAATADFRLLEVARLAILASAQYLASDRSAAIATLELAASLPRGLQPREVQQFSPEMRALAEYEVADWPQHVTAPSVALTGLEQSRPILTHRELEIMEHLVQGHTRAQMAEKNFVTLNTIKGHLKSIYLKLNVSTASDAVLEAQLLGLV